MDTTQLKQLIKEEIKKILDTTINEINDKSQLMKYVTLSNERMNKIQKKFGIKQSSIHNNQELENTVKQFLGLHNDK